MSHFSVRFLFSTFLDSNCFSRIEMSFFNSSIFCYDMLFNLNIIVVTISHLLFMGNDQYGQYYQEQLRKHHLEFLTSEKVFNVQEIKFPLSTQGVKIIDANGKRVKFACVNWSGGHMCRHCVDGLEFRKLEEICQQIKAFGFNSIRLTYSLQLYYDNPIVPEKYLTANPKLFGKRAMQIMDIVVDTLTKTGIMVIMNNHVSSSMWCCSETDGEGLWWTPKYPQYMWIDCIRDLAIRYAKNQRVVAVDLRNQIRKTPDYSPTWGDGNPVTDWRRAATIGANEVLKANPKVLVMIGGLEYGLNLEGIKKMPVQELVVKNKLVYTGHFYGFSWPVVWAAMSYQNFKKKLFKQQTFVRALGVPFFLGQFGTNTADTPWRYLMKYLQETDIDWSYWPLDGFKCEPKDDETYGIYNNDFSEVRNPWLLQDLNKVQKNLDKNTSSNIQ